MKVRSFQLFGIRSFEDTGHLDLSPNCNVFVGPNNSGKSTLLKSLLAFQGQPFSAADLRGTLSSYHRMMITDLMPNTAMRIRPSNSSEFDVVRTHAGPLPENRGIQQIHITDDGGLFYNTRPHHQFVPFLARRKTEAFNQNVTKGTQDQVSGTLSNIYSRIDLLANYGHPDHTMFRNAVEEIVGLPIATQASGGGKEAGYYLDRDRFVTLDRAGDGVTEMVALIVELCVERGKVFVLEEPETNLHPHGLKALLRMIRASSTDNQFIIATHSNIVVRELGYSETNKVFRVYREDGDFRGPSRVEEIPRTSVARIGVMRELGYEFGDLDLHDAWLFLEESSAETIFNEVLVPMFTPKLAGRLRTYSAGGVSNVESSVEEFQRLVTFVHLEPAYRERLWIRTDGDEGGAEAAKSLREKFKYLTPDTCAPFAEHAFEKYYPQDFASSVSEVLALTNRRQRASAKTELLFSVLNWTRANPELARTQWAQSANEPIDVLSQIEKTLT